MFKLNIPFQKSEAIGDDFKVVSAISSTSIDRQNERITKSALEGVVSSLQGLSILKDHNNSCDHAIGRIDKAWIDGAKLFVEMYISKTAEDIRTKIKEGVLSKFSVGGKVTDWDHDDNGLLIIKGLKIFEASLTPVPANMDASIYSIIAKSFKTDQMEDHVSSKQKGENMEKNEEKIIEPVATPEEKVEAVTAPEVKTDEPVKANETNETEKRLDSMENMLKQIASKLEKAETHKEETNTVNSGKVSEKNIIPSNEGVIVKYWKSIPIRYR